jgi:hypothetical protein
MKIGEWDAVGPVRGLVQLQLGKLGAAEYATHVTRHPETGRLRILIATDLGLLDYSYSPAGSDVKGAWLLRGQLNRWVSVKGVRLQSDAQLDVKEHEARAVWHLVIEEPRAELAADSTGVAERSERALLDFAQACMKQAR